MGTTQQPDHSLITFSGAQASGTREFGQGRLHLLAETFLTSSWFAYQPTAEMEREHTSSGTVILPSIYNSPAKNNTC